MNKKKILQVTAISAVAVFLLVTSYIVYIFTTLPKIITVDDYQPRLVSTVYDRNEKPVGEFFRERRIIVPYADFPDHLVKAFIAAEDASFFDHGGINYQAIIRAIIANIKAGRKVQGGSTITQQVAKSLLLTPEKTYTRKLKEAILAYRMEANLSKEEILYLYLNQIYLGHGAYGVEMASRIYFKKNVKDIDIKEAALLAGLPQAPSRYSPVIHPERAKDRQKYVLRRMAENNFITEDIREKLVNEDIKVYTRENLSRIAPYYVETIRQFLVQELGEEAVLDQGLQIYTGIDYELQLAANKQVQEGLRVVDKRQGYRGAKKNFGDAKEIEDFLAKTKKEYSLRKDPSRIIRPDGSILDKSEEVRDKNADNNLPEYLDEGEIVEGIVERVDDKWGLTYVRFGENQGIIDIDTMKWARKPDPEVYQWQAEISKPSEALKEGDLIDLRIVGDRFYSSRVAEDLRDLRRRQGAKYKRPEELPEFKEYVALELEQEPEIEAGLLSFDLRSEEILTMVGGYDFNRSEFNRTIQAGRQTGSVFKPIVYIAALDRGFAPNSVIIDSPIVYEETIKDENDEEMIRKWKPDNYSEKFGGDILFRNAIIKSKNVPTVKVQAKTGLPWVEDYARRLGIFSPLNRDQTLGLGSSSVTLYEMTKVFANIARGGKRIRPLFIRKVTDAKGNVLLEEQSLDKRFAEEMEPIQMAFEQRREEYLNPTPLLPAEDEKPEQTEEVAAAAEDNKKKELDPLEIAKNRKSPPFFFKDESQLISPQTAYLGISLLEGVVKEGTGRKALALGRPTGGKTGTTNGFYDAWFIGFTRQIAAGVWVGYDTEQSLGRGETGGRTALPIWVEYMKIAHENLPIQNFKIPDGIVFANIDNKTGNLASPSSEEVVNQAFLEGTEPKETNSDAMIKDSNEFFKEDLAY